MNEVGFCPVVSGVLSSGVLSCGVLSVWGFVLWGFVRTPFLKGYEKGFLRVQIEEPF